MRCAVTLGSMSLTGSGRPPTFGRTRRCGSPSKRSTNPAVPSGDGRNLALDARRTGATDAAELLEDPELVPVDPEVGDPAVLNPVERAAGGRPPAARGRN